MRIYYINLARRTDRRVLIEGELTRLGLSAERIEATTPDDIPKSDIARYCDPNRYRFVSPPELACTCSHLAAMQRLIESGAPHALILEDDVVLGHRLPTLLAAYDAAPPAIDLLRLETDDVLARLAPRPDSHLAEIACHRYFFGAYGAAAYVVTRDAATRLLADASLRFHPIDIVFDSYARASQPFVVRQAVPALAMQRDRMPGSEVVRDTDSDLLNAFYGRYFAPGRSWPRRLAYGVADFVARELVIGSQKTVRQHLMGARKRRIPFEPVAGQGSVQ